MILQRVKNHCTFYWPAKVSPEVATTILCIESFYQSISHIKGNANAHVAAIILFIAFRSTVKYNILVKYSICVA